MAKVIAPSYILERVSAREKLWEMVTYINKQLRENNIGEDESSYKILVTGWKVLSEKITNDLLNIYEEEGWIITDVDENSKEFKVEK